MEHAQKALVSVLLGQIFSLGLISKYAYENAQNLIYSQIELPTLLHDPTCLSKGAKQFECTQTPQ